MATSILSHLLCLLIWVSADIAASNPIDNHRSDTTAALIDVHFRGRRLMRRAKQQHRNIVNCGPSPALGEQKVDELISSTGGILLVAIHGMRCTNAIEAALQTKNMHATTKYFTSSTSQPGAPPPSDASEVWTWLLCKYPDGDNMHSFVFVDGKYVGTGFQAATKFSSGVYDHMIPAGGRTEVNAHACADQYPNEAQVLQHYMGDKKNRVLLFGWQGCPCTGIAERRLSASSICYEGRTWADPSASLMAYLQCETKDKSHHSFVYFRKGHDDSSTWHFLGTGFDMEETALSQESLISKVELAGAQTICKTASVAVNVYGGPLEECRQPSDGEQGGSWLEDGKCSETTGGIHQICIQAGTLPHDFSMSTYQTSDWSESRTHNSHCICVGAWSTYMTEDEKHPEETKKITPRCKAIPETVLTKKYMANWKNWNGFVANVGMGLGELLKRCLTIDDTAKKCGLKERFMKLNSEEDEIRKAVELDDVRALFEQVQCTAA